MAQTLTEVIDLIETKLKALKNGTAPIFGEVFKYDDGDFKKFPTALITESGGRGQVIDSHRNQRTYNFTIKLYQEQSQAGKTKAEAATIMRSATDAVLLAFDADKDFSGEVDIVRVVEFDTDFKVAAGTFNFATFRVDVVVLVHSY
jgi:hypothetical protein